jgi:release factor glutamine methyltransferase
VECKPLHDRVQLRIKELTIGVRPDVGDRSLRNKSFAELTIRRLTDDAYRRFNAAGVSDPRLSAEWLAEEAFGLTRTQRILNADQGVSAEAADRFHALVERRLSFEPLQYIIGRTSFMGLEIGVEAGVLIPRPETETVVEHALELIKPLDAPSVLDIGTGSGCIAIAIKHFQPAARVSACDVSTEALAIAEKNARDLDLDVRFLHADILSSGVGAVLSGTFDLIISNPPYIPGDEASSLQAEVRDFEPHRALFTGDDPMTFYRVISRFAENALTPGGYLVFETHADFGQEVVDLLSESEFANVKLHDDLSGRPRVVVASRI